MLSRKNKHSTNSEYFVENAFLSKLLFLVGDGNFVKKEFRYQKESGDIQWHRTNKFKKLFAGELKKWWFLVKIWLGGSNWFTRRIFDGRVLHQI